MKKITLAFLPLLFTAFGFKALAQNEAPATTPKNSKKESQVITIQTTGDKTTTLNVQVDGDKVLINGKPISEFKDADISINKKKIIIRDGNRVMNLSGLDNMNFNFNKDAFASMANKSFLGVSTEKDEKGAKIIEVTKGSGAEKAGLEKDDIITKVGDKKVSNPADLSEIIGTMKPNDEVKIHYLRGKKEKSAKATLQARKMPDMGTFSYNGPEGFKSFSVPGIKLNGNAAPGIQGWGNNGDAQVELDNLFMRKPKLGLKIQDTNEGNGVKVLEVEDSSAAALAGLQKDDLITSIGDNKVTNTDEAREQLQLNTNKAAYPVKAVRNGSEMNFTIKIPKKLKTANL